MLKSPLTFVLKAFLLKEANRTYFQKVLEASDPSLILLCNNQPIRRGRNSLNMICWYWAMLILLASWKILSGFQFGLFFLRISTSLLCSRTQSVWWPARAIFSSVRKSPEKRIGVSQYRSIWHVFSKRMLVPQSICTWFLQFSSLKYRVLMNWIFFRVWTGFFCLL